MVEEIMGGSRIKRGGVSGEVCVKWKNKGGKAWLDKDGISYIFKSIMEKVGTLVRA